MGKWLALLLCLMIPAHGAGAPKTYTAGGYAFQVAPTPSWVESVKAPAQSENADLGTRPLSLEVHDYQILIDPDGITQYTRVVFRILNQTGISQASHLPVMFIPDYQALTLHEVSVIREGKSLPQLDPDAVRMTQLEPDMNRRVYRGIVTASLFVKDLRVGDRVALTYSIAGTNPVLGEHFFFAVPLAWSIPTQLLHVRVRGVNSRPYYTHVYNSQVHPVVTQGDGYVEANITAEDVAPFEAESNTPPESFLQPEVQVSSDEKWDAVQPWAGDLFAVPGPLPAELKARIEKWRQSAHNSEEAALLALDYLQKEIAYASVSIGESALRPAQPERVLQRGFGDCKDKALLLATLLREMGLRAYPALVSTIRRGSLAQALPGIGQFDHAIVLIELNGESYWVDPTAQYQTGPLATRFAGDYGKALVVGHSSTTLEDIVLPAYYSGSAESVYHFTVTQFSEPVKLTIETRWTGVPAETARARWQADRERLERLGMERFKLFYPSVESAGPLLIEEDPEHGTLLFKRTYRIPEFFTYQLGKLSAKVAAPRFSEINPIEPADRKAPWALFYRAADRYQISVDFPEPVSITPVDPVRIENRFTSFTFSEKSEGARLSASFDYYIRARSVPPEAIAEYNEMQRRMQRWAAVTFDIPSRSPECGAPPSEVKSGSVLSAAQRLDLDNEQMERSATCDIESGRLTPKNLARAHLIRADARGNLARHGDAAKDSGRAIELDPDFGAAYASRVYHLVTLGRLEEAGQAYIQARDKAPDNWLLHESYGRLLYYTGKYAEARTQFRKSIDLQRNSNRATYDMIWSVLSSARAGGDFSRETRDYLEGVSGSAWPVQVLSLLSEKLTPEQLYQAARNADEKTAIEQLCEAYFFAGQYYLLKGDAASAKEAFERSRQTEVHSFIEYAHSAWELDRLSGSR